jgi:hypothetical protein
MYPRLEIDGPDEIVVAASTRPHLQTISLRL